MPPERAVQEIAVIIDVVIRGKHRRINIVLRHIRAQLGLAIGIFLGRERCSDFLTVLDLNGFRHLHVSYPGL